MDNLSVHHNSEVLATMERLNFKYIFNAPYSPEFNPIEFVFAKVKRYFKSQKLRQIVNNKHTTVENLISESFAQVTKEDVENCCRHTMNNLLNY